MHHGNSGAFRPPGLVSLLLFLCGAPLLIQAVTYCRVLAHALGRATPQRHSTAHGKDKDKDKQRSNESRNKSLEQKHNEDQDQEQDQYQYQEDEEQMSLRRGDEASTLGGT
ncbi:hypothetical protein KR067_012236 [Drosophila pandora]|nr:hypothetical protein KR067_012236 [Drosophila pandora]